MVNNLPTVIITLVIVLNVALIIRSIIKDKKSGKHNCGAGCAGCAMSELCHKTDKEGK
ncbi:MAG: FeoB-associated Cys-rich membrane protein [Clostridia bacterium]|nr:FeoB-associated Cys-rich membrane protein [Clostridia bacterium]